MTIPNNIPQKHHLKMFSLAILNIAAVLSLRGLPLMAETGTLMIFYLLFASFFFLIPTSLISAELATGWPERGGVYHWVKEAFGSRLGFIAIWLQWIQNVVWYPTVLSFAAAAITYSFGIQELASNNAYIAITVIITYWLATFVIFCGMKLAGPITVLGVISGTIAPAIFIIILGITWIMGGHQIAFLQGETHQFLPNLNNFSNIAFLASIVLLFAGMEVGAVHVRELKDPKKEYPRAVFLATIIILVTFLLGSMAVATVLPASKISLVSGVMEAFRHILDTYNLRWLLPILGLFIAFGVFASVLAWIIGPSKGLLAAAKCGEIPPFLAHTNKRGIQTHILVIQGIIVTVLSLLFLVMKNVSDAFFLLSVITITPYLVMYFLLFATGIKLRHSQPNVHRTYRIPGGKYFGMWVVGGIGFLASLFAFCIAFIPPAKLQVGTSVLYVSLIVIVLAIFIGLPIIIHACKKPSWIENTNSDLQ